MTLRLSGHFSMFGLVFFVLKYLLRKLRDNGVVKISNLPRRHVRIEIYLRWAITTVQTLLFRAPIPICLWYTKIDAFSLFWYTNIVM